MRLPSFHRPICLYCKHFDVNSDERKCTAFPNGIPDKIWLHLFDHREAHPNDGGKQFEMIDEFQTLWQSDIFQSAGGNLVDFEKNERVWIEYSIRDMELRRKYGVSEPRIEKNSDKYKPNNKVERDTIINYRIGREIYDAGQKLLQEKGELIDYSKRMEIDSKARIKATRDYITKEEEIRFIMAHYIGVKNNSDRVEVSSLIAEAYREIGEEQRLLEIFQEIDMIDYLKQVYEKLNLKFPSK